MYAAYMQGAIASHMIAPACREADTCCEDMHSLLSSILAVETQLY
jgi:hypothetical protein